MISTEIKPEKAILIGLINQKQNEELINEYLDELEFLAVTSGAITKQRFIQKLSPPHPSTFVGKGKIRL